MRSLALRETGATYGVRHCRRKDSNLHSLNGNQVLSLARLPIPPFGSIIPDTDHKVKAKVNNGQSHSGTASRSRVRHEAFRVLTRLFPMFSGW